MHPVDDAIREDLLERRLYSIQSTRFYVDRVHPRPLWTERKFGEAWSVRQCVRRRFGMDRLRFLRSTWAAYLEPHTELERFCISDFCEQVLQNELQKNMTE